MDTKEQAKPRVRRRHDEELKQRVLAQCAEPGASVAKVAMAHGLNANLVHKWRRQANAGQEVAPLVFVPVTVAMAPAVNEPPQFVEVELQRGSVHVRVRWPMAAAGSCASWLREILR